MGAKPLALWITIGLIFGGIYLVLNSLANVESEFNSVLGTAENAPANVLGALWSEVTSIFSYLSGSNSATANPSTPDQSGGW